VFVFVLFGNTFPILVIQAVWQHGMSIIDRDVTTGYITITILSNAVISSFNVLILHFLSYYKCYVILI